MGWFILALAIGWLGGPFTSQAEDRVKQNTLAVCIGDIETCNTVTGRHADVRLDCGFINMHDPMTIDEDAANLLCRPPAYTKKVRVDRISSQQSGRCGYIALDVVCAAAE